MVDTTDYQWLSNPYGWLSDAACVTAAPGANKADVLAAFGAEPATIPVAETDFGVMPAVGVVEVPGGIVAVEVNGWEGSRAEVLRAVAAHGQAASAYWNVNALTRVSLARDGRVLSAFEAWADSRRHGDDPGIADEFIDGLDFDHGNRKPCMLVVVERFTGLRLTADIVESIDRVHLITPVPSDPPAPIQGQRDAMWRRWAESKSAVGDRQLADMILAASDTRQRDFALWAALAALAHADLADEPLLTDMITASRRGVIGPVPASAASVIRQITVASHRATQADAGGHQPETRKAWMRTHAVNALQAAACYPDPDDAAVRAATSARLTFWNTQQEFLETARDYFAEAAGPDKAGPRPA